MHSFLTRLKKGTEPLNYGRDTLAAMARRHFGEAPAGNLRVLDLGAGTGADLANVAAALGPERCQLAGIESHPRAARALAAQGVAVHALDLEKEPFPFPDGTVDLVLANQVLEHTKEVFWILSETARVLRPGGGFLVGLPNLASLHNRVLLLFGAQPTSIEWLGPHVRGATAGAFLRFATAGAFFKLAEVRGGNFYPFPAAIARPLSRILPRLSVSLFFRLERTGRGGSFLEALDGAGYETPFYRGG
jgi:SAM-dependent methyltransferase